jgi:hypothetical protein
LQDAAAFLSDVMRLEETQESREPGRLVYPGQRDNYHRQRSDPRDNHQGSWNRNERHTGRYEGGRDNRNSYMDQEWQGRINDRRENRNPNPDRDGDNRNQAPTLSTPTARELGIDKADRRKTEVKSNCGRTGVYCRDIHVDRNMIVANCDIETFSRSVSVGQLSRYKKYIFPHIHVLLQFVLRPRESIDFNVVTINKFLVYLRIQWQGLWFLWL